MKKENQTKEKKNFNKTALLTFFIGLLVGAVIATGCFYAYEKYLISNAESTTSVSQNDSQGQAPGGDNSSSENSDVPAKPDGDSSSNGDSSEPPAKPDGDSSSNGDGSQPPEMPSDSSSTAA